ncbi:hypothetical protein [Saccharopolyspora griseoalba]|uniref:Uncharacterized protein n=1 Tax=Saccharopolyspora griseoalba TaxID=1431848 RepID=A0ABW2LJW3_9PSEU
MSEATIGLIIVGVLAVALLIAVLVSARHLIRRARATARELLTSLLGQPGQDQKPGAPFRGLPSSRPLLALARFGVDVAQRRGSKRLASPSGPATTWACCSGSTRNAWTLANSQLANG